MNLNLLQPAGSNTVVAIDNITSQRIPGISVTQTAGAPDLHDLSSYGIGADQWRTRPFTSKEIKTGGNLDYSLSERVTIFLQIRNIFGKGKTEFQTPSDETLLRNFTVPSRYSEFGDPIYYLGVKGRF
ncbi:MAG TPA: hypothetical protein VGA56_16455 [Opitutaceae bacterium]